MGIINWLYAATGVPVVQVTPPVTKAEVKRDITYKMGLDGGLVAYKGNSEIDVNESSAVTLSVVYRAATVISEAIGTMPIKLYRKENGKRIEETNHPLADAITFDANPEQSWQEFLIQFVWNSIIFGTGYAEIVTNDLGEIQFYLIPSQAVIFEKGAYTVITQAGKMTIPQEKMLVLRGPSPDGSVGYKLVEVARDTLSFSLALQQYGVNYFENNCQIGGVLETLAEMEPEQKANARKSWAGIYSGIKNVGSTAVLDQGLTYKQFQTNNQAGQFVENKQQEIYAVCRFIGVEPIFVFEYGRATWGNSEQMTRNFLQFSLNPKCCKIEDQLRKKCISKDERRTLYPEFVRQSVIQMDAKTQAEVWKIGVEGGWIDPDQVASWQNLEPVKRKAPEPKEPNVNS